MKLAGFILAVVFASIPARAQQSSAAPASTYPAADRQADRDAIHAHIDKIFRAYIDKDAAVIRATHAQNWIGFSSQARSTISGIDQYMADIDGFLHGPVRMDSYKMLEFDVVFYGDTAVIPYVADVTYSFPGGSVVQKLRVLDVYAKVNGEWNQVGSDTQLHPESIRAQMSRERPLGPEEKTGLLAAREAVWKAFFNNDSALLTEAVPADLIAIDYGDKWSNRDDVLASSKHFADQHGKLLRLEFPATEIQAFGATATVYSKYLYEIEIDGKSSVHSGRATEMFVNRDGKWLNVGWHLDAGS
jgi:hypothetical protein